MHIPSRQQDVKLRGVCQTPKHQQADHALSQKSAPDTCRRTETEADQEEGREEQEKVSHHLRQEPQINPPKVRVKAGGTEVAQEIEQREPTQKESQASRQ